LLLLIFIFMTIPFVALKAQNGHATEWS